MTERLLIQDILAGKYPNFHPVNPNELVLLEYREDEVIDGGIVLCSFTTKKYNQVDILPKWRVLAVGTSVDKYLNNIKVGDQVIVGYAVGRLRHIDEVPVRYIHWADILAKAIPEVSDYKKLFERKQAELDLSGFTPI